jgi:cleavage and polyadenylation specificity factor subunit 3
MLLDCGIHPGIQGVGALPYFDGINPSEIDCILISHFHLDHAASLPYFLAKTRFRGRVFMTHPTKAIYKMLLSDYVRVSNAVAEDDQLYSEADLERSMDRIEPINYHQELSHNGIKFWSYNAGHVLGAAMFMIEIAGVKILYTGDFSREEDRHLMSAEVPEMKPDILIVESTYGVQIHESKTARENRFTEIVSQTVARGGRCLIPVFALGRAQELLLILDEFWEAHPELQRVPIYYASSLAKRCMTVYQTYINMMNDHIRKQFTVSNPFIFKHVASLTDKERLLDPAAQRQPAVVMASPGMLQSGLSRELFEAWCTNKRNTCLLPGYCVEGTLAKTIMSNPSTIDTLAGVQMPLKLSVAYISFSAHSDFQQTSEFIDMLRPPHIILVHGDSNEMARLKHALVMRYESAADATDVYTPRNGQTVSVHFRAPKIAKTAGQLALAGPRFGELVSGVLVQKDYTDHMIVDPSELDAYTQLTTSLITQRQRIPFQQSFELLGHALEQIYELVEPTKYEHISFTRSTKNQAASAADDGGDNDNRAVADGDDKKGKGKSNSSSGGGASSSSVSSSSSSSSEPRLVKTMVDAVRIHDSVVAARVSERQLLIEWPSNAVNDMLADSIVSMIMHVQTNPSSIEVPGADAKRRRVDELVHLLEQHYADVQFIADDNRIHVSIVGHVASIHPDTFDVECQDTQKGTRLQTLLNRFRLAALPYQNVQVQ